MALPMSSTQARSSAVPVPKSGTTLPPAGVVGVAVGVEVAVARAREVAVAVPRVREVAVAVGRAVDVGVARPPTVTLYVCELCAPHAFVCVAV
jgi:hypothetical protein